MLPPKSARIPIASFCVEQERWSARGKEDVKTFATASAAIPSRERIGVSGERLAILLSIVSSTLLEVVSIAGGVVVTMTDCSRAPGVRMASTVTSLPACTACCLEKVKGFSQ